MVDGWVEWRSRFLPKATPQKPRKNCNFGVPKSAILGVSGAPVAIPMPAPKDPQTHSKFAIPGARNQQFWGSRGVPGGPGGGPGCSWGVPGGLEGSRGAPGGVPGGSWEPPGRLPGVSGSPWGGPGRSREGLGAFLKGSRGVLGGSRGVLGGSWEGSREVWGRSWGPRIPRKLILDRFGADLGWNLGPGTTENCGFPLGFC